MSAVTPDLRGKIYRERRLMQPAETTEFLRRQKVANVGTVDVNGWPYVVPLAYIYEGGDLLYLHTGDHQGHFLTNVQNNPRICVEVSEIGDLHADFVHQHRRGAHATSQNFLGVWNLLTISSHRAANSVSPAWIQAHGHAQIFGWVGSFVLGIGFYSIPKLRRLGSFALAPVRCAWALWTTGVALRWLGSVYPWHWHVLVPLSSVCELVAFLVFFRIVSGHRAEHSGKATLDEWVFVVIAGSMGFLLTLLVNVGRTFYLSFQNASPEVQANFDQRFLVLETWGCLVPFVWGFSAKWLPVFLGLRPVRGRILLLAVGLNSGGVLFALAGAILSATVLLLAGLATAISALRLFEPPERPAKVKGVHSNFPFFVRLAYNC